MESKTKLEIKAAPHANITFKNERGVPLICKGGILEVTARGDRDTTSIYAYDAENHIVGKVNVLSYDKVTRKICLVPIGDTKASDAAAVKQELDAIFAKLMVDFEVTIGEPIKIDYADGKQFTHGGSGMIGVYNTDQKAAISKLKERGVDEETAYLFLVKDCNTLKSNDTQDVVSGYMPRGYQFGFIYKELCNFRTMAHELCHGAFHLKHTFDATDYLAPENTTDNLMDYNHGEVLNHWQWKDAHQPKSVRFKWLQEEDGAEAWGKGTRYKCISTDVAKKIKANHRYFHYPDGSIVDMKEYLPSGFYLSNDVDAKTSYGAVAAIHEGGKDLYYAYTRGTHSNVGFGYSVGGKAILKYAINSVENPDLETLNPVRVYIDGDNVKVVDYHGNESIYSNIVCECSMAKYRELTAEMLISEVDESLSKAPRLFYDPKTNEIIVVTEVHDLKWIKVTKYGPQYDLESLVAQGATYHYYTEAELANTEYNQLRTDVQNAMNEGGKVVMIGLAATIAAPYLIEYAAVYGEQILVQLAKKSGEKAVQELIKKGVNHFIKKCAKDEAKKDAKLFIRGAVSQFFVSSMIWAAEKSTNGRTITSEDYLKLVGIGEGVEIFNLEYGNESRDFWIGVLQAGFSNVIDEKYEKYHFNKNAIYGDWILTLLEDIDCSKIISAVQDDEIGTEQAIGIACCEIIRKMIQSVIDAGSKKVAKELKIGDLDIHAKELLFLTIYDSLSKLISNSTTLGLKLYVIDHDVDTGWQIFEGK